MIVGITSSHLCENGYDAYKVNSSYINALTRLGVTPVILVPQIPYVMPKIDGIIIAGGYDSDPAYYGEAPIEQTHIVERAQDEFEFSLIRNSTVPVLGICRGFQSINIAFGGSLHQHIVDHQGTRHSVFVTASRILTDGEYFVNSFHHQCIKKTAENLRITAVSEDGIVEGVEFGNTFGVQWHPELMENDTVIPSFIRRCNQIQG